MPRGAPGVSRCEHWFVEEGEVGGKSARVLWLCGRFFSSLFACSFGSCNERETLMLIMS